MAKGLLEKAGRIQFPAPKVVEGEAFAAPPMAVGKPKTAPGTLMGFMATQSEAIQENGLLREQMAQFDGASPSRAIDPRKVRPSAWANRHAASFASMEFQSLKAEIASAGGNVQPIKVRPIGALTAAGQGVGPSNPPAAGPAFEFEIVFGHRRHRACLELGLPVLCVIENASDQELFVQMERENRNRADLSAWEQGVMYARALDKGLYPSNRQLASAIGRDLGDVGRALSLARLPGVVIEAFGSPLELQFRWAKPLSDAQQSDPEALIARAKALKGQGELGAKAIFEALTGVQGRGVGPSNPPDAVTVEQAGRAAAVVATDSKGRTTVRFQVALNDARREQLVKLLQGFLAK